MDIGQCYAVSLGFSHSTLDFEDLYPVVHLSIDLYLPCSSLLRLCN